MTIHLSGCCYSLHYVAKKIFSLRLKSSVLTRESVYRRPRASQPSRHSLQSDAGCLQNGQKTAREEEQQQSRYLLFFNRRCRSRTQLGRHPAALTTDDPGDLCSAETHRSVRIMGPTGHRVQPLMDILSIFFDSTGLLRLLLGL